MEGGTMIRGFARPIRRLVAQFAIVCIVLTGIPAVASAQQQPERLWPHAPLTLAQMKRMADEIERVGVLDAHRLTVLRTLVAIAGAPNAPQRSALLRKLPVSISVNLMADGRVVKNFFYRGKIRLSTVERPRRDQEEDDEVASGPHASESSSTDASELCFEDEEPPCATEAEMDEYAMLAVYIEGESLAIHDDVQKDLEVLMICCNAAEEISSGPSASYNCVLDGIAAASSLLLSAAAAVNLGDKIKAARFLGKTVSSALLSQAGAVALGTFGLAFYTTTVFIECTRRSPAPWHLQHWFEPVC
jgi:hypothetical protein